MRSNGVSINFKTHFSFVFSQNRRLAFPACLFWLHDSAIAVEDHVQ